MSDKPPDPASGKSTSDVPFRKKPSHKDFIFGKLIGEGSYSSVYLAKAVDSGDEYAIKVLQKSHITREKKVAYVNRERDVFAMIQKHPFFVHLFCTFQDPERLYFVLSYARRGELLDYIKKLGCFDQKCTRFYVAEIILALERLRELGIVHRDLKPENILLDDNMHIQITDFGSAKIMPKTPVGPLAPAAKEDSKPNHSRKNSFVGTAQYVSPEVLKSKETHYTSDLWALGCIIYQLLSGRVPFWAGHEYGIFQKILNLEYDFPEGFDTVARDLVEKLLVVDSSQRLGSEETGGFQALKDHAFFNEFDWNDVESQKAPDILPYLPPGGECQEPLWGNKTPGYDPSVAIPGWGDTLPQEITPIMSVSEEDAITKKKKVPTATLR